MHAETIPVIKSGTPRHKRTSHVVLMRICVIAAFIDISFFFLFHFLNSPILAWVNIVSVVMYCAAYYLLKYGKAHLAVVLIWIEVLLHAALGIVLIGWDSGFHYFLLMFIPSICVSVASRQRAAVALVILFAVYIGLDALTWYVDPIQPINPLALSMVHIFNLSVVFLTFSYISFYYLSTVRRAQTQLRKMAETDPLTDLFNRRHMSYLAEKEIARLNDSQYCVCVMLIDLDHFKSINDTYGHQVGDEVLVCVAQIMKQHVRSQDLISRWGGEEFLIVMPNTNKQEAMALAESIRIAFFKYAWDEKIGAALSPTISAGVTELRQLENMSAAVARADRALYSCKKNGRNRIEYGEV